MSSPGRRLDVRDGLNVSAVVEVDRNGYVNIDSTNERNQIRYAFITSKTTAIPAYRDRPVEERPDEEL